MLFREAVLIFIILILTGCASLEKPRWALLGDTSEEAYFIDRQEVKRLANGNYAYPVKLSLYQPGQPHKPDTDHATNRMLFIEMDCRSRQWTETSRGVVDQNNKIMFKRLDVAPRAQRVQPDSIHFAAYRYLCNNSEIIAQHNHQ